MACQAVAADGMMARQILSVPRFLLSNLGRGELVMSQYDLMNELFLAASFLVLSNDKNHTIQ